MAKFEVVQGVSRGGYQLFPDTDYETADFPQSFINMLLQESILSYKNTESSTKEQIGNITDFKAIGTNVIQKVVNEFKGRGVSISWYDNYKVAVVDGYDWGPALAQAITDAQAQGIKLINFDQADYLINSDTVINLSGLVLLANNTRLYSTNNSTLLVKSAKGITGFIFDKVRIKFTYDHDKNLTQVRDNVFKNHTNQAIYGEYGFNTNPEQVAIIFNRFDTCSYGVLGVFNESKVMFNTFKNSTNRNIEINSGSDNVIAFNNINGGITGVALLTNRVITKRPLRDNQIIGNIIRNVTEESIGLDLQGNNAAATGSVIKGKVSAFDISNDTITPDFSLASSAFAYLELYVYFLSGSLKGMYQKIIYMGGTGTSYLQLDRSGDLTGVAVNDDFVIISPIFGNLIAGNRIHDGYTGISLWGNSLDNVIRDNVIDHCTNAGVNIVHLAGMTGGDEAPCSGNVVKNNLLRYSSLNVKSYRYGTTSTIYNMNGNIVENNKIHFSSVLIDYQDENTFTKNNLIKSTLTQTNIQRLGRPTSPHYNQVYYDQSINKPIIWTGTQWIDYTGTAV